ncbi:hypothetical protein GCM10010124_25700 [Pilimelia terevasa]|uniref:HTH cro/C1-type domain-containing protein n=1 Tax=Pilimelia terevasa TaxID=53372 RepID=A0A8J3BM94_9ACTN|nr:helix-turn-helix transcriptional regulator [Pilimelia terevasa]GGK31753.1 hypothetical protein GCM10010124_25700 [Pilimelia terevasa]
MSTRPPGGAPAAAPTDGAAGRADAAAAAFAGELGRWRRTRGLSKKQLAARMRFDPSYVSHIESCRHRPTADFARRAEAVLLSAGAIWRHFEAYARLRRATPGPTPAGPPWLPPTAGLVIERELTSLHFDGRRYRCTVRRALYNAGADPVTRFAVRVGLATADAAPTAESLRARVTSTTDGRRRPVRWQPSAADVAAAEAWLVFEDDDGTYPILPGTRATLDYTVTATAAQAGPWLRRTVRLPTGRLAIDLDLPGAPDVRGTGTSPVAGPTALRLSTEALGDRTRVRWSADNPPLQARYRLDWRFAGPPIPRQRLTTR